MKIGMKKRVSGELSKLLWRDGSFLLEAMIGTAILSIVLVFFATVSISAFMLMQRAYYETQITEEVFLKVESRKYSELLHEKSGSQISKGGSSGISFTLGKINDGDDYVSYITAGGGTGTLDMTMDTSFSRGVFVKDLYAFRYQGTAEDYRATFYILKGEK